MRRGPVSGCVARRVYVAGGFGRAVKRRFDRLEMKERRMERVMAMMMIK